MKKTLSIISSLMFMVVSTYAVDFVSMREEITQTDLTDLQQSKIINSYIGKSVSWNGWVDNVKEDGNSYVCLIDMDKPEVMFSTYDFKIEIDEATAMRLRKNQRVTIYGIIESIDATFMFDVKLRHQRISVH